MVWIPGGQFWMGSDDSHMPDTKPWHRVYVDGYWMDRTEVTNEQFARFAKATGYVTVAERKPRAEDYPGAPPENLIAGSVVFTPPTHPVNLNNRYQWWSYAAGASWRHPEGPAFEFASRGGLDRKTLHLGRRVHARRQAHGQYLPGKFSRHQYRRGRIQRNRPRRLVSGQWIRPVRYGGQCLGMDRRLLRFDYYQTLGAKGEIALNPTGPPDSFDPAEPGVAKRVQRGGSFLCTDQYCSRYIAGGRGNGEPDTGTSHLRFRTVLSRR
jgi:formylglycine-generating enzyme